MDQVGVFCRCCICCKVSLWQPLASDNCASPTQVLPNLLVSSGVNEGIALVPNYGPFFVASTTEYASYSLRCKEYISGLTPTAYLSLQYVLKNGYELIPSSQFSIHLECI